MKQIIKIRWGVLSSLLLLHFMLISGEVLAQKKVNITSEKVAEQCKELPYNDRIRLTVARFNVTTPKSTKEFGANMATMLSNALQESNCFNVLSRLADKSDLEEELEFSKGAHASKENNIQDGKMLTAQVVVTGEITEYNLQSKGASHLIIKTSSETLKLGFIIQVKNPETREIYFSKSFNVTGKSSAKGEVSLGGVKFGSGSSSNPAEANALEQGIIAAMEYLTKQKDAIAAELQRTAR